MLETFQCHVLNNYTDFIYFFLPSPDVNACITFDAFYCIYQNYQQLLYNVALVTYLLTYYLTEKHLFIKPFPSNGVFTLGMGHKTSCV